MTGSKAMAPLRSMFVCFSLVGGGIANCAQGQDVDVDLAQQTVIAWVRWMEELPAERQAECCAALERQWSTAGPELRPKIAEAMARSTSRPEAVAFLVGVLDDSSLHVRAWAAWGLAHAGATSDLVCDVLAECFASGDHTLRTAAVDGFAVVPVTYGDRICRVATLQPKDSRILQLVAERGLLDQFPWSDPEQVRVLLTMALSARGAWPTLRMLGQSPQFVELRLEDFVEIIDGSHAQDWLIHHLQSGALDEELLTPFFTSEEPSLRAGAIRAISFLGESSDQGFARVGSGLTDPSAVVRRWSAEGIDHFDQHRKEAVELLRQRVREDPDSQVQERAVRSLADLGADAAAAVPELLALLDCPSTSLRQMAMFALAEVGQAELPVLFQLRAVLERGDAWDRGHARWALDRLEPGSVRGGRASAERRAVEGVKWSHRGLTYANHWIILQSEGDALALRLFDGFDDEETFCGGVFFEAWYRATSDAVPVRSEGLLQQIAGVDSYLDLPRCHTTFRAGELVLEWAPDSPEEGWVAFEASCTFSLHSMESWHQAPEILLSEAPNRR